MSGLSIDGVVDLDELAALDRRALAGRWLATFGHPAPRSCQAPLLRNPLGLAFADAGAAPQSIGSREVDRMAQGLRRAASESPAASPSPGTRLLREWQGQTH